MIDKIKNLISVDPGSNAAGFAYFKNEKLVESRQVKFKAKHSLYHRLYELSWHFQEFLKFKGELDYFAIETPFIGKNPQVGIKVGQTRGIILNSIFEHLKKSGQIHFTTENIIDISPAETRSFYGLSSKKQKEDYQKIIRLTYPHLTTIGIDEADAIGIGEVALNKIKNKILLNLK